MRNAAGEALDGESLAQQFKPTVFLYDNYPGGVGLSTPLYDLRREVVSRAHDLVSACGCKYGCPACVGPILASDEQRGYSPKAAALTVLALLSTDAAGQGTA